MSNRNLLITHVVMFVFGVIVGCALFALFQSYIFIMALLGVVSLMSKLFPVVAKAIKQNQKEEK